MRNGLLWCALDLGFSDREMNTLEKKYTKHIEDFAESLLDEAYENPISVKEFREADLSSLIGQLMWAKKLISSRL
jgi:hypothetical protein